MRCSYFTFAIFPLILTACSSNPVSYLPTGSNPIVNIESDIANKIELDTGEMQFSTKNLTEATLKITYKLFWYDQDGVTQSFNGISDSTAWQYIQLQPKQKQLIKLSKPTEESTNYRLYLRGVR